MISAQIIVFGNSTVTYLGWTFSNLKRHTVPRDRLLTSLRFEETILLLSTTL